MINTLVLQDKPQGCILSYFYKFPGAFSLSPKCLLNFLSDFYIPPCGRIFQIMEFTLLENLLIQGIITHALPHSKLAPKFLLSSTIGRRKLLIPPDSILSKICFPKQQKGVEETMICFIKIQSENMKMTWNIRFFIFSMICNFFKCDGFTVF